MPVWLGLQLRPSPGGPARFANDHWDTTAGAPALSVGVRKGSSCELHKDPQRQAKVAVTIPMGRDDTPDQIAGAVAWLLSIDVQDATGGSHRIRRRPILECISGLDQRRRVKPIPELGVICMRGQGMP